MKKVVIHKAGGYDQLKIESQPDPKPASHEVVVKTSAVGVNYADCCVRWGVYDSAKVYVGWPITPGFEFSGTIAEVGSGVDPSKLGKKVVGITRFNGYADLVKVSQDHVFEIPHGFSMEEAAGFPTVYMTAYHAMFQLVRVSKGMTVLVHSAAGGVGSALLQLSKIAGVKAVAVVGSSHKVEWAEKNGATSVIDKSKSDLWTEAKKAAPEGYDIIFDANGPSTLWEGYKHLRPTGKLITYGFHSMLTKQGGRINYLKAAWGLFRTPRFKPMSLVAENKGVVGFNLSFLFERDDLLMEGIGDLLTWARDEKIKPMPVSAFKFEEVGAAHKKIESGLSIGKIVLVP